MDFTNTRLTEISQTQKDNTMWFHLNSFTKLIQKDKNILETTINLEVKRSETSLLDRVCVWSKKKKKAKEISGYEQYHFEYNNATELYSLKNFIIYFVHICLPMCTLFLPLHMHKGHCVSPRDQTQILVRTRFHGPYMKSQPLRGWGIENMSLRPPALPRRYSLGHRTRKTHLKHTKNKQIGKKKTSPNCKNFTYLQIMSTRDLNLKFKRIL